MLRKIYLIIVGGVKMIRKIRSIISVVLVLSMTIALPNVTLAQTYVSENKLDKFLTSVDVPEDLLNIWTYEQKLELYQRKDENLSFDSYEKKEFSMNQGTNELEEVVLTRSSTIPESDLLLTHSFMNAWVNGVKHKIVFANYEWLKSLNNGRSKSSKGDKIGIAIPNGWEIISNEYNCREYKSKGYPKVWNEVGNGGGRPYELNYFGAVWSLTAGEGSIFAYLYKGYVSLEMVRVSTSAQNKVIGTYVHNYGNSTSWSIGWGPLSVSISGNKGFDKAAWDTSFTY